MKYDVDNDFEFDIDEESGLPLLPKETVWDGELLVLPNGRYLPPGAYTADDGNSLIYEPKKLSPFADMLAQFK